MRPPRPSVFPTATPVAIFLIEIFAYGTANPDPSLTEPESLAALAGAAVV
jgi:hypothetical protein